MKTVTNDYNMAELLQNYQLADFFPQSYHQQLQVVRYDKGEALCQQGEDLTALFYILTGKAKIVRRLFNGKEYVLETPTQSRIIGDVELMTNRSIVSSVVALETVTVLQLPLHNKKQLLKDPAFLYQIGRNLAQSLYQQNISSSTNVSYSVKERLATYILIVEENGHFQLDLSLLADTFGTSYRHLIRVIKQFIDQGIISKPKFKHYQIENKKALEELVIHH